MTERRLEDEIIKEEMVLEGSPWKTTIVQESVPEVHHDEQHMLLTMRVHILNRYQDVDLHHHHLQQQRREQDHQLEILITIPQEMIVDIMDVHQHHLHVALEVLHEIC